MTSWPALFDERALAAYREEGQPPLLRRRSMQHWLFDAVTPDPVTQDPAGVMILSPP